MKRLKSVDNEQGQLEMGECDCGYHFGVDATYLDQVEDFKFPCPSCKAEIDTAVYFPEDLNSCKKCDTTLDEEGACQDETCPYSDWSQNVPVELFNEDATTTDIVDECLTRGNRAKIFDEDTRASNDYFLCVKCGEMFDIEESWGTEAGLNCNCCHATEVRD